MKNNDAGDRLLKQVVKYKKETVKYIKSPFTDKYYDNFNKVEHKIIRRK